jgi:general secretion pathway protein M
VLASCEVEQAAMQRLLYDLEAGMPYLFIEQFVAQAPQASQTPQAQGSGRMRVLLAVAGRWEGGK